MTKKDYIAIADVIKTATEMQQKGKLSEPIRFIAENLCDVLYEDNNNFSFDRFLVACGLK